VPAVYSRLNRRSMPETNALAFYVSALTFSANSPLDFPPPTGIPNSPMPSPHPDGRATAPSQPQTEPGPLIGRVPKALHVTQSSESPENRPPLHRRRPKRRIFRPHPIKRHEQMPPSNQIPNTQNRLIASRKLNDCGSTPYQTKEAALRPPLLLPIASRRLPSSASS
jgi:hypothetical protein